VQDDIELTKEQMAELNKEAERQSAEKNLWKQEPST